MSATFAIAGGGAADSGPNNHNGGRISWSEGNELQADAYDPDAVLVRLGGPLTQMGGAGGGIAFDWLPTGPGGRRVQMGLIHGEQSEIARFQPTTPMGSISFFANNGEGEADGNSERMMRLDPRTGTDPKDGHKVEAFFLGEPQWESLVRQLAPRLGGTVPTPPPPTETPGPGNYDGATMQGSFGKSLFARQIDKHDVLYAVIDGKLIAIWASDGGPYGTWLGPK